MTTTLRIHHSTHRGTSVTNPTRCSQPLTSLSGGGLLAPTSLLNALGYKTVLLILAQTKGKIKVFYNDCVVPQNLTGTVGGERSWHMAEKESRAEQNLPVDGFAARVSLTASVCHRQNASRLLHHAKKDRDAFASRSCVAEKEGLEPSHRLPGLHP